MPSYLGQLRLAQDCAENLSLPSAFSMTLGELDSITATHEFVVPRSMPTILQKRNDTLGLNKKEGRSSLHPAKEMLDEYLRCKGAVVLLKKCTL